MAQDGRPPPRDSEKQTATTVECRHYAMNLPTSGVITCCDSLPVWEPALTSQSFKVFTADELAGSLARTLPLAGEGKYRSSLRLAEGSCSR
jgi:hypothetical protein